MTVPNGVNGRISNCGRKKMERPLQEKRRGVTVKSNHLPRFDTATCIAGKHDGVSEETTIDRKDLTGAGD
ncbi:unnamed protein product [Lasius platythorax]|uniref:Uncharacterized protein n=1 Tax=Lasius platythorax TaxID=488582 RepID=A0AAV2NRL6_9HYME